jgi:PHD/YefM family antitoxin component YafN of YafNO toxin-antitoxin module
MMSTLDLARDVVPVSELGEAMRRVIEELYSGSGLKLITNEGHPAAVLMDVASYQGN